MSKVPYASRLFKREATPAEDMLLLITPHIIMQGEKAQQANFEVKPRVIRQDVIDQEGEEERPAVEISP